MVFGIYLHIPFCQQKCFYCDFPSYAGLEALHADYIAALRQEILAQGVLFSQRGDAVDTVYIGGGTPTALTKPLLLDVVGTINSAFSLLPGTEFTIEANPGTVDEEKLIALRQAGVNRISFGVQSFEDALLQRIGRIHTGADATCAIEGAKQTGFDNISLDLMYGLPGQHLDDLAKSVRAAVALEPAHISVYGLQVEEGTPLSARMVEGTLDLPDEDADDGMYEYLMRALPERGYARYEISNFARPGFTSRHNLKYWRDLPYLGLGAAAHSYVDPVRFSNTADVRRYIAYIKEGKSPIAATQQLDRQSRMEEFCFLALRTGAGISRRRFEEKFSCNFFSIYGHIIETLTAKELIVAEKEHVFLTQRGMKYGNQVFREFLLK